jgi:hypothetical protein
MSERSLCSLSACRMLRASPIALFFCIVFSHRRAYIRKTHAALNSFWLFNELAALFFAASRGSARDRGPTTPNYLAREMGSDTKVL